MKNPTLSAKPRKLAGRKVKTLRNKGILPANMYGKGIKSQSLELAFTDFEKVYKQTGETGLVELVISGKKSPVLIHNVQTDPVTDNILHADFLKVNLKEKVSTEVPVELIGESTAEKQGLGTVVQYIDEIEVEALPTDLPEKFEIDLSSLLEVNDTFSVKDLAFEKKKVTIKVETDEIIVKVEPPRKEEEEPPPAEEEVVEEVIEGEEEPEKEKETEKPEEKKEETKKEE